MRQGRHGAKRLARQPQREPPTGLRAWDARRRPDAVGGALP